MPLPQLDDQQVAAAVPAATDVRFLAVGGQKTVFSCLLDGKPHVLKFMLLGQAKPPGAADADQSLSMDPTGPTFARAVREVETMSECNCPTLVRLGPIGMTRTEIAGQDLLFFSEQRIDGSSLADLGKAGTALTIDELFNLAEDVTEAIKAIWAFAKVHRDIKPGNIMRRADSRFIVLDVGLVLDLDDESLTEAGIVVGTRAYLSPEQMDLQQKRQLDFRSDLFALGIVLYQMATLVHPFAPPPGSSTQHLLSNIANNKPVPPSKRRPEVPGDLEQIILRLLAKRPHLRYRTCEQLLDAIKSARAGGVK